MDERERRDEKKGNPYRNKSRTLTHTVMIAFTVVPCTFTSLDAQLPLMMLIAHRPDRLKQMFAKKERETSRYQPRKTCILADACDVGREGGIALKSGRKKKRKGSAISSLWRVWRSEGDEAEWLQQSCRKSVICL